MWTRSAGVWTQQGPKLVSSGSIGVGLQGWSVSISANGNTAIIGANDDNSGAGAAWVWTRSGGIWTQKGTKLVGLGALGNAFLGRSVFVSADGNTVIIGGIADNSFVGAAWVFASSSPSPSPSASPIQLLLDTSGPSLDQAAALESLLFLRDPFPVVNGADLLNLGVDRNTRVIIFLTNLQLPQGETSSSVVVTLTDSNNQSYDIAAEDVRPVPNFDFSQVIFRLPDNLPAGTCTLTIKARGQISNAGTIRIRI